MADPQDIAKQGHQFWVWLENVGSGEPEIYCDRVQDIEPTETINQTKAYELGRKGPVGASEDPPDMRIAWTENWAKWEQGLYQAGKDPAVDTSFNLGDLMTNDNVKVYVTATDSDDNPVFE